MFHMAFVRMLHRTQTKIMFLNGNTVADELPNIQFSLTTVRDARYQVFRPTCILFICHWL